VAGGNRRRWTTSMMKLISRPIKRENKMETFRANSGARGESGAASY